MSNFVVEFPLETEKYQDDILNLRFEIGRQIYNSLVTVTQKRYKELIKTRKYRNLLSQLEHDKKKDKLVWKAISEIIKQYGMSEYSFHAYVKRMQQHFSENIDSSTAQKIASSLWKAYYKLFYGNGKKVHYKKFGCFNSLEGKSNKCGIRFKDNMILWNGLIIPVTIDNDNDYERQAMKADISYCRIIRKYIRSKYKYYVQIVFKGIPPIKISKETDEAKHNLGRGDVGLDIGTSTVAIASEKDVKIFELDDKVQNIEKEKSILLRKMDRSRRATNPGNFNTDGTIRKQGNKKVVWKKSNHYINYQNQLKELHRKQTDVRKYQHECLANYIISLGNKIYVETMNFAGLQKRSTKTEISEKTGRYKKKKRYGKSISIHSPAMLMNILDRKLRYFGTELIRIDTWNAKASQFNHFDGTYKKKKLTQRWIEINGIKCQRDLYSAFLISNIASDLKSFDIKKCENRFDNFCRVHKIEVDRLTGLKNSSCIGI